VSVKRSLAFVALVLWLAIPVVAQEETGAPLALPEAVTADQEEETAQPGEPVAPIPPELPVPPSPTPRRVPVAGDILLSDNFDDPAAAQITARKH